jgi:hypothetical protein
VIETKCFLITPTERDARFLRRYCLGNGYSWDCDSGYHNATCRIEDGPHGEYHTHPYDDPRWPKVCRCGYEFLDNDTRQVFPLHLYMTPDGHEYVTHDQPPEGVVKAPPGAMWFTNWCPGPKKRMPVLWVMLPNDAGSWCVDGSSSGGGPGWERTGEPPDVTATPSIDAGPRFHGHLTNGVLKG